MTYKEIAKEVGFNNGAAIQHLMNKYKLPRRKSIKRNQFGVNNTNWNGGQKKLNGYIMIRRVDHPRNVNGYVPKHILIMEEHLGRYLRIYGFNDSKNEIVHHINGNKQDNEIGNLQLMAFGQHIALHNTDKNKGRIMVRDKINGRFMGILK